MRTFLSSLLQNVKVLQLTNFSVVYAMTIEIIHLNKLKLRTRFGVVRVNDLAILSDDVLYTVWNKLI